MTFSGQDPRQRNVEDADAFRAIVSGGLNTAGNRLLMSGDDSPNMYNTDTVLNGGVAKRVGFKGTTVSGNLTTVPGTIVVPWRSVFGYQFYVIKNGTSLVIYYEDETGTSHSFTKTNVFPTSFASKRPDHVVLSQIDRSRIVYVGEGIVPVQLTVIEGSNVGTLGAPGNTIRITLDKRFAYLNNTMVVVRIDGARRACTAFTRVGSTNDFDITVSGTALSTGNHTVDVVGFTWQWWAEALKLKGDQIVNQIPRPASDAGYSTPIPERLRMNISEVEGNPGVYPIQVYLTSKYGDYATRVTTSPVGANDYIWSVGTTMGTDTYVHSPNWITWGATKGTATPVHLHRYHRNPFTAVYRADRVAVRQQYGTTAWTWNGSVPAAEGGAGTGGTKYSFVIRGGTVANVIRVVASNTESLRNNHYFGFDGTSTANGGVVSPQDDYYSVIASDPAPLLARDFVGSVATGLPTITNYRWDDEIQEAGFVPAYGIWEGAHYGNGSFPTTICLFQNRLALGGFTGNPMKVLISAVADTSVPGEYFNNFQIFYEEGVDTDPLDVQLPGRGDDIVLCVREFQASLFVFTRLGVFRISGEGGIVRPTSVFSSLISSLGTVNAFSVVAGVNTLYFLTTQGIFSLRPTDDAGGYSIVEVSAKIKNLFGSSRPYIEITSYLLYDTIRNILYVGISDKYAPTLANQLFVYQIDREAWTQYTFAGSDNIHTTHAALPSLLNQDTEPVFILATSVDSFRMFTFNTDRFTDVIVTSTPYTLTKGVYPKRSVVWTTVAGQTEYYTTQAGGADWVHSFRMFPVSRYQDCLVYLGGNLLTWGVDYVKTDRSSIILTSTVGAGLQLQIDYMWTWEGNLYHPVSIFEDQRWVEPSQYSVSITGADYIVTWNQGYTPSGNLEYSLIYPGYHETPVFTRSRVSSHKRMFHYYGYYDNAIAGSAIKPNETSQQYMVGVRPHDIDFDLAFIFNSERWAAGLAADVYGFDSIHWDYGAIEFGSPAQGQKDFSRVSVPIVGAGYGFQVAHLGFNPFTFQLVGYEVKTRSRKSRGYSYTD